MGRCRALGGARRAGGTGQEGRGDEGTRTGDGDATQAAAARWPRGEHRRRPSVSAGVRWLPGRDPLSRDAAGYRIDGGGRAVGKEDGVAAGAATVVTGPFRRVSSEDAWSLPILSGLLKFTEGVFAKRFYYYN